MPTRSTIFVFVCACLSVTVRTDKTKIFYPIVRRIPTDVIYFKRNGVASPLIHFTNKTLSLLLFSQIFSLYI